VDKERGDNVKVNVMGGTGLMSRLPQLRLVLDLQVCQFLETGLDNNTLAVIRGQLPV
jgi:hypothetical protein